MKLIYKNRKRKTVTDQALEEFRRTRAKIQKDHPELLEKMRAELQAAEKANKAMADTPKPQAVLAPKIEKPPAKSGDLVQIDRSKNIETVLRFLAMNPERTALKNELKSFLQ